MFGRYLPRSMETATLRSKPSRVILSSAALFSFGAGNIVGSLGVGVGSTGSQSAILTDVFSAFCSRILSSICITSFVLLLGWLFVKLVGQRFRR